MMSHDYTSTPFTRQFKADAEALQRKLDNRTPRFFIDHGMIHDRVTGKHVVTDGTPPFEDSLEQVLALLNGLATSLLYNNADVKPVNVKDNIPYEQISTGELFNALLSRIDFDGADPRTFSLAELQQAIKGAEWPK